MQVMVMHRVEDDTQVLNLLQSPPPPTSPRTLPLNLKSQEIIWSLKLTAVGEKMDSAFLL